MNSLTLTALVCVVVSAGALKKCNYSYPFTYVTREKWGARPPGNRIAIEGSVPFVVVHHSFIPPACDNFISCIINMIYIQDLHQITNGWEDIGYNFAVGGDGAVYVGRGWGIVGAHAIGYNTQSVGIVLIGDFTSNLPPTRQLETAKRLIATGVELGYISPDYQLIGHRQASETECPGHALFEEISTWDRFVPDVKY